MKKLGDSQDSPQKYWESVAFQENGSVFSTLNFGTLLVGNCLEMRFKHRTIGVVYNLCYYVKSQKDLCSKGQPLIFFLVRGAESIALKFLKDLFMYDLYRLNDRTPQLTNKDNR